MTLPALFDEMDALRKKVRQLRGIIRDLRGAWDHDRDCACRVCKAERKRMEREAGPSK